MADLLGDVRLGAPLASASWLSGRKMRPAQPTARLVGGGRRPRRPPGSSRPCGARCSTGGPSPSSAGPAFGEARVVDHPPVGRDHLAHLRQLVFERLPLSRRLVDELRRHCAVTSHPASSDCERWRRRRRCLRGTATRLAAPPRWLSEADAYVFLGEEAQVERAEARGARRGRVVPAGDVSGPDVARGHRK
jgi:hypothetical protein